MLVLVLVLVVLVLVLLVVVVLLLLVVDVVVVDVDVDDVVVVAVAVAVLVLVPVLATHRICAFLWAPKNRHIGGAFAFFLTLSEKKTHCKYRCFLRLGSPPKKVFTMFFRLR